MQKNIQGVGILAFAGLVLLGGCSASAPKKSADAMTPPVWSAVAWEAQQANRPKRKPKAVAIPVEPPAAPVEVSTPELRPKPSELELPVDPPAPNGISVAPNQCWAQVVIPPRITNAQKELTVREASVRVEVTPAVLKQSQQSVVVKEGAQTFNVAPPRFKAVAEKVLVSEEVRKLVVEPAVFEDRTEQVEVESARVVMRECRSAGPRAAGPNSHKTSSQCAVELPARYQSVTRKVQVKPETVREEVIPAVYKTVTRMVLDQEAQVVPVPLPETRIQVPYKAVETPSVAKEHEIPAQTKQVAVKLHEGMPQLSWRQVLCEKDMSPSLVTRLQKALQTSGFDIGKADGKLGNRTWQALQSYQQREGLASGFLTYETLDSLKLAVDEK